MSFLFLVLGHLLGDFTFQTNKVAGNKVKCWKWNVLHSAIVTVCMLPFAFLFGMKVVVAVLLNGVAHYFIDHFKARMPVHSPMQEMIYFICDQTVHIYLIYIISGMSTAAAPVISSAGLEALKFLVALIAVMSFGGVLNQYILRIIFPFGTGRFFLEKEKLIGGITRSVIFLGLVFSLQFSDIWFFIIPIAVVLKVFYYHKLWNRWLKIKYFYTRFTIDMIISVTGFYILNFSLYG